MSESDYRCPPMWNKDGSPTPDNDILAWLTEAVQEGDNFLRSQAAFKDIEAGKRIIEGRRDERLPKGLSRISSGRVKRECREVVASESNLRPIGDYKSDNRQYHDKCVEFNKLLKGWWYSTSADRSIREALQWAVACGTAYISPVWEPRFWTMGRGDIALHAYGPTDVLPIQLPRDRNLQRAYAVIIRTEQPINLVRAMYPLYADQIEPDRTQPSFWRRTVRRIRRYASPALNIGGSRGDEEPNSPVVDLYNVYILDTTINQTGKTIPMGEPDTSWYYEVPSLGSDVKTHQLDRNGNPLYRKAQAEDAMLYPLRRLLVATKTVKLSDGPSPWWHGMVPLVKFTFDDWPWTFLGFAPVRDGGPIEDSINRLLRAIDDSSNTRMRPPMSYDPDAISEAAMERLDTRQPNQKVQVKPSLTGRALETLLPSEYYDVPAWIFQHVQHLEESLSHIMASRDLTSIAKARQLPASDTLEKLLEMAGPIVQDMSRNMEGGFQRLGEMVKYFFLQYYSSRRTLQMLGKNGVTEESYDYDPAMLFPSHLEGENRERPSIYTRMQRARAFANNFPFHVTPNSAHRTTQMAQKLLMVQLFRAGFPVDPWTVGEALDIAGFGPPPEGTHNVMERWVAWMFMRGEMQSEIAQMIQGAQQDEAVKKMTDVMGRRPQGRPPTGQKPPKIVTKDRGTRSSIVES